MLPVEGLSKLSALQQVVRTTIATPVQAVHAAAMETRFVTGQRVDVAVVAALANGRYQVLANGETLDVNLPMPAKPGDQLEMRVVSNVPKLVLALGQNPPMPGQPPRGGAPLPPGAAQVSLSDTGTRLTSLLQQLALQPKQIPVSLHAAPPMISTAPADPAELAGALRSSLQHSGLFYESHQAEWMVGKRPVADLLAEPQGKLPQLPPRTGPGSGIRDERVASAGGEPPAMRRATDLAGAADALPVHKDAVAMVQQQLQTLESGRVQWRGEVWPGQDMEWRVEEREAPHEDAHRPAAPAAAVRNWSTSMRLQLPSLGDVEAVLTFEASGLSVAFRAMDAGTVDKLADARPGLRESIESVGLHVLSLTVKPHA